MTELLNPCFICGADAEIGATSDVMDRVWIMVQCPNGCRGNHTAYEDEESAITEWNNWNPTRIELPRLREEYQRALDAENERTGREPETTTLGITRDERRRFVIRKVLHLLNHVEQVCHDGNILNIADWISEASEGVRIEMGDGDIQ